MSERAADLEATLEEKNERIVEPEADNEVTRTTSQRRHRPASLIATFEHSNGAVIDIVRGPAYCGGD